MTFEYDPSVRSPAREGDGDEESERTAEGAAPGAEWRGKGIGRILVFEGIRISLLSVFIEDVKMEFVCTCKRKA